MRIPLMRPYSNDQLKQRVCEVLDSGYLTEGPTTRQFEQAIADYTGAKHCLAVTSCTTGLEMALRALEVGPGDEVIVPDYTYPATASVVNIVGAEVVIVDVTPETMLVDYDALEAAVTPKTKALIPVSLFGNPLDWEKLAAIRERTGVPIIEDAACALGSSFKTQKTGTLADISVFSHHPRKFITTGEGGTVTTNNGQWAEWMSSYKHFGIGRQTSRTDTCFDMIGTNYKLSNVLAAIGLDQMSQVQDLLKRRQELADRYDNLLKDTAVQLPQTTVGGSHSYQSYCVLVPNRDQILTQMRSMGIEVQIGTYALHMHPAYQASDRCKHHGNLAGSRYAFEHCLTLPLYHDMTKEEQKEVTSTLLSLTGN